MEFSVLWILLSVRTESSFNGISLGGIFQKQTDDLVSATACFSGNIIQLVDKLFFDADGENLLAVFSLGAFGCNDQIISIHNTNSFSYILCFL